MKSCFCRKLHCPDCNERTRRLSYAVELWRLRNKIDPPLVLMSFPSDPYHYTYEHLAEIYGLTVEEVASAVIISLLDPEYKPGKPIIA